jgi:ATP-dependent Lhr-like helicase
VFPAQLACAENLAAGDREIPDHPLVKQTLDDCLTLNMDVDGLVRLLTRIESGEVEIVCRELTSPSPLAQEILGAKPYAFLDDAPAEERRTLAVQSRRYMTPEQAAELGQLDPGAIDSVRAEAWPQVLTADELHDALALLGFVTVDEGAPWRAFFDRLRADGRATGATLPNGSTVWVAAERLPELTAALPGTAPADALALLDAAGGLDAETALRELVRSRLEALGPVTAETLARPFGLRAADMAIPLAALEQQGTAMRGRYTAAAGAGGHEEWCERRLLARIHRYTLKRLRNEIEPATLADYQRFLFHWQGLGGERRQGREALLAALGELQGLALPAALWEREVLPARIVDYGAPLLDQLCTAGEVVWWRPRPSGAQPGARATTVATSPIAIVPRGTLPLWRSLGSFEPVQGMSGAAERVMQALRERGALFFIEIVQTSGLLRVQVEEALGELVARGVVTADSFTGLRAVLTPQSRRRGFRGRSRLRGTSGFDAAGRWALLPPRTVPRAAADPEALEHGAKTLLRRYGVMCRRLLAREPLSPSWRELLPFYRTAEARGEIRGGRFIEPFGGEQFALIEAVEELRRLRRQQDANEWVVLAAADPASLHGITDEAPRAPVPNRRLAFRNGAAVAARAGGNAVEWLAELTASEQNHASGLLTTTQGELEWLKRSPAAASAAPSVTRSRRT